MVFSPRLGEGLYSWFQVCSVARVSRHSQRGRVYDQIPFLRTLPLVSRASFGAPIFLFLGLFVRAEDSLSAGKVD